jgi:RHS repeat-associated protein
VERLLRQPVGSGAILRHVGNGLTGERLLDWTPGGSNIRVYGTNGHHDTTWTASSTGSVSATLRYDPWGNLAASTGTSLPDFRFQGSWYDTTTDLSWVVTRWYAPAQGRFISEDSLLGRPTEPGSRHLFAYGAGDPVGRWDPDGRDSYKTYPIKNIGRFKGVVKLALFIRDHYNYAPGDRWWARLHGDGRQFTSSYLGKLFPDCNKSRVCVTIDFPRKEIRMRVHKSCGDWGVEFNDNQQAWFGYGCDEAYPMLETKPLVKECASARGYTVCVTKPSERVNLVQVREKADGTITLSMDITQSRVPIIRPDLTVNSFLVLLPKTSTRGPRIGFGGEGFPSEELYWYGTTGSIPSGTYTWYRRAIHRRYGDDYRLMGPGGEIFIEKALPQS